MWRRQNPHILLVRIENGTITLEHNLPVPQRLNTELPYNPATPCLSMYPGETKTCPQKNLYTNFHGVTVFIKAKKLGTAQMSINYQLMNK